MTETEYRVRVQAERARGRMFVALLGYVTRAELGLLPTPEAAPIHDALLAERGGIR
jgi:hypothetical protein